MRKMLCYNNTKEVKETIIMTKSDIEMVVKRYPRIKNMVKQKKNQDSFYLGNRLKRLELTDEIKIIYETVEDVYLHIREGWIKRIIGGILKGESDVYLLHDIPCSRSLYYSIKKGFIEKIYQCCIAKQMITYDELLRMEIYR